MKGQYFVVAAIVGLFFCCAVAGEEEPRWVWSSTGGNRRERAFRDESSGRYRDEEIYARAERDREPTTKRPAPGAPLNEEIDDYPDGDDKNLGTRQYPFGINGGQIGGGGFNNYPGIGGYGGNPIGNGILVGPGGPTGIIGRPQQYFPTNAGGAGGFPGAYGQPGFGNGGGNLGFPQQQQPGGIGFGGGFGQSQGYPQTTQQGAQYPGGYYNNGQFPVGGQYPVGNQFGGAQFPGANGVQYPAVNNQYPGGSQYPGGGPIYTEGYGLFTNNYPAQGGIGYPQTPFGGFNGFGTGYDEQSQTKRKLQIEEKSSNVESRNIVDRTVDDKISRNAKKST